MKFCNFVSAYQQSLINLNEEALHLDGRIARMKIKCDGRPESRLASKLALYKRQREGLVHKHRGAASWIGTVAKPIFSVIGKQLGATYQGFFSQESDTHASMRFLHSRLGPDCSLVLRMTLARLCTEPSREVVNLHVQRSVVAPGAARVDDEVSLETSINDLLIPLRLM
ncbi:hypothetical protein F2S72_09655 [Pseudomonas syringae pv. actinidiae]|nr:hypothetical protein [Pseudomonas syringae pv. actinidiae]